MLAMARINPEPIITRHFRSASQLFVGRCFFLYPLPDRLAWVKRFPTYVNSREIMYSFEVFDDIMVILRVAYFRYAQVVNKLGLGH